MKQRRHNSFALLFLVKLSFNSSHNGIVVTKYSRMRMTLPMPCYVVQHARRNFPFATVVQEDGSARNPSHDEDAIGVLFSIELRWTKNPNQRARSVPENSLQF